MVSQNLPYLTAPELVIQLGMMIVSAAFRASETKYGTAVIRKLQSVFVL